MARSSTLVLVVALGLAGSGCEGRATSPIGTSVQALDALDTVDPDDSAEQCTWTLGYWKNHPEAWPVSALSLGDVVYTQSDLLQILQQPVDGNGLVSLAHQLIAAKLNVARGARDVTHQAIARADAELIGSLVVPPIGSGSLEPDATSATSTELDALNNGLLADTCTPPPCGVTDQCDDDGYD